MSYLSYCDGCKNCIYNVVYHCKTCFLDKCQECFIKDADDHLKKYPDHKYIEEIIRNCKLCKSVIENMTYWFYWEIYNDIVCCVCYESYKDPSLFYKKIVKVYCDKCFKEIKGLGYSCNICKDFQVCPGCYVSRSKTFNFHDPSHSFTIRTATEDGVNEKKYKTFYEKYLDNTHNEKINKEINKEINKNLEVCLIEI